MTVTHLGEARARLVDLERERAELLAMIAKLGQDVDGRDISIAARRVALFASPFRGRPDVFATRCHVATPSGARG